MPDEARGRRPAPFPRSDVTHRAAATVLLATVLSCSTSRSTEVELSHAAFHPLVLHGTPVVSSGAIGQPRRMVVQGRRLWIADRIGDPFVHWVDLDKRAIVRSVGRTGQGPGDFASAMTTDVRPGDSLATWVFDIKLERVTRVMSLPAPGVAEVIRAPLGDDAMGLAWLDKDHLLAVGYSDTARFAIADTFGKVMRLAPGSLLGSDSIPIQVRRDASTGFAICVEPGGNRFALAFVGGGRIDYYRANAAPAARVRVPLPSNGDFVRDRHGEWEAPMPRYYYLDCSASDGQLYALFSGRLAVATQRSRSAEARYVHAFDWKGHLTAVYELDRLVGTIAIDGDSVLYAAGGDLDGVYAYRLHTLR